MKFRVKLHDGPREPRRRFSEDEIKEILALQDERVQAVEKMDEELQVAEAVWEYYEDKEP